MKLQTLLASRSFSNESNGRDMFACLADQAGVVVCYFPTESAYNKWSHMMANVSELNEVAFAVCQMDENGTLGNPTKPNQRRALISLASRAMLTGDCSDESAAVSQAMFEKACSV